MRIFGNLTPLAEVARVQLEKLEKRMEIMGLIPNIGLDSYTGFITILVSVKIGDEYFGIYHTIGNNPSTPDLMPGIVELKIRRMVEWLFFEGTIK